MQTCLLGLDRRCDGIEGWMASRLDNAQLFVERNGSLHKSSKIGDAVGEVAHLQMRLMVGGETLAEAAIGRPLNQSKQTNAHLQP